MIQLSLSETQNLTKSMILSVINPVEIPGPTSENFYTQSCLCRFSAGAVKDFKCSFEAKWGAALPSLPWLMATSWVAIKCPGCSIPQGIKTGRRKTVSHKSPDFCNWNLRVKFGRLQRAEQEETFAKRCEKNITALNMHICTKIVLHADTGTVIFPGIHIKWTTAVTYDANFE